MNSKGTKVNGWSLLQLIYALREAGFAISLSDLKNVLACLKRFPDLDLKTVLRVNFIHRSAENELFEAIWSMLRRESLDDSDPKEDGVIPVQSQISLGGQGLGRGFGGISVFPNPTGSESELVSPQNVQAFLQAMPKEIEELATEDQVQWVLGQMNLHQVLNSKELSYQRGEITEEELDHFITIKAQWQKKIRNELLWNHIQKENQWGILKTEHWLYRPLESFSQEEKNTVQQALKLLGKRLAQRPGFRKKASVRGEINMQRAIQELIRGQGCIFRLEYQKRVPRRPELVVLCDISNSVLPYSEFLLFLVSHLKLRFRKVRIFLFIDSLWDVTNEEEFSQGGSQKIQAWSRRNSSGYSDYGKVFAEFQTDWLAVISSQATLLILGDGRNNYRPAQAEYLQEINAKVNRVYWLNPLDEKDWFTSDNVLKEYKPYCSEIFRCRTVKDLQLVSRKVF
ncbi:VWA domain-containing protein [Desulfitobacterium sp.]|uniref:VWA domain-containing protein n=1 Tax=Desulfitobacterium sp. TaxID=49981 RepID=UPI002BE81482|nr:VWA domain-containing protein [Desulfitobacterium sp.]HVJ48636.1 VWA domain-containing protein [Desulfitobacterium sp.]